MNKPHILTVVLAVLSTVLVACGGGSNSATRPAFSAKQVAHRCPVGDSQMGCAVAPVSTKPTATFRSAPSGPLFPDVSNWQGNVDWSAVKSWQVSHGWRPGAVFKIGEGLGIDAFASRNAQQTAALGFWRAGYWFVRNSGCAAESSRITDEAKALGLTLVVLDLEVPEARGYGACLSPPLKRAGFVVVEYTAPGTNPGGADTSDPLWEATYGSSFSPIWHPVVGWQFTDGQFGSVVDIPGIGHDDVNVDYGISKLGAPLPPPDPYLIFPKTVYDLGHKVKASEYNVAKGWNDHKCLNPTRRPICGYLHYRLVLLRGRIWVVAHRTKRPDFTSDHRHQRFQYIQDELHQSSAPWVAP